MEIKLSLGNYCGQNCKYCYTDSKPNDNHIDMDSIDYESYIGNTVVLTGGSPLTHIKLIQILEKFKSIGVKCKIEVYQHDIQDNLCNLQLLEFLVELGLVSEIYLSIGYLEKRFVKVVEKLPIVFCVIIGLFRKSDYAKLKSRKNKLKILGFISQGRGETWIADKDNNFAYNFNLEWLKENFEEIVYNFKEVELDDLAKEQIEFKNI